MTVRTKARTSLSITHGSAKNVAEFKHDSQPSFMSESQTCLGHEARQKKADQKIEDGSGAPCYRTGAQVWAEGGQ